MDWRNCIKKEMRLRGKYESMGKLLGGRGMRITLDALKFHIRQFKKFEGEEAENLVVLLEEAEKEALSLVNKFVEINRLYEKNL
tara:strand:- start:24 stop:275 length:252 start_codon:yes stop_codon:yes gene_type:complete